MQTHIQSSFNSHLMEYVTAIWEVKGRKNVSEVILPKGVIEIVFNFADTISGFLPNGNKPFTAPKCFVQGFNTYNTQATYIGQHHLFGIRLQPHRVQDLLGIPSFELSNSNIDLGLIDSQFIGLWHRLGEAESFERRVEIIEEELPILSGCDQQRIEALNSFFMQIQLIISSL